jgi:protein ImuB
MEKRFVSIWFRHLATDWFTLSKPELKKLPFVLRNSVHGRMVITAANEVAEKKGITSGMVLADARAIFPTLEVLDDKPDLINRLLKKLAAWCIRFTPVVAIDPPDGLLLDATGCSHLWGGDVSYINDIVKKLTIRGYDVHATIADTPGVAWAVARYGKGQTVVAAGNNGNALLSLPPEALRLEQETIWRLHRLGLHKISQFITIPRPSLRKRFGQHFLSQIDKALGVELEILTPVLQVEPYQERLPCLEPIITAKGIEIALQELLKTLCSRLIQDQKGIRTATFKGYRVDGKVEQVSIETNLASQNTIHLFKLFEFKLPSIEPALGIELFVLEAPKVEEYNPKQEKMWEDSGGLEDVRLSELIDRLATRVGKQSIHRYVPAEHYWPERSFKRVSSLHEVASASWRTDKVRPLHVLKIPERIDVTAPIPDYPPMLFIHKGKLHKIIKADGPERIEQEWWIQKGQHRDYYRVEDEEGNRYWLFRLGHYHDKTFQWFLHGFFS